MPIFRILGGNCNSSSSSNNNTSRSSFNFMGNNNNNNSNHSNSNNNISNNSNSSNNSNNSNSNSQTQRRVSNQSTYPGLRLQRSPNSTNANNNSSASTSSSAAAASCGLFSSIRSGSTTSTNSTPYVTTNNNTNTNTHPVIRGSTVTHSPPPAYNSRSLYPASARGGSNNASGLPPYVDNNNNNTSSSRSSSNTSNNNATTTTTTTRNTSNQSQSQQPQSTQSQSQSQSQSQVQAHQRPGAYAVTRSTSGMSSQVYRVTVPPGVIPGNEFTVHAGNRRVRVRCPITSRPGHSLQITLPPEPITSHKHLNSAPLTRACSIVESSNNSNSNSSNNSSNNTNANNDNEYVFPGRPDHLATSGGAVPMTPEVRNVNRNSISSGAHTPQTFLVTIPPNIYPGMQFTVNANGQRFMVTCPPDAGPNRKVRIVPPPPPPSQVPSSSSHSNSSSSSDYNNSNSNHNNHVEEEEPFAAPKTQVFEVVVPPGVRPNQPFTLMANGQRVLVTCPPNVMPGQKIRFQLPVPGSSGNGNGNGNGNGTNNNNNTPNIQLSYKDDAGSAGWCRTIRVTDMKFQWVRVDNKDNNKNSGGDGSSSLQNKKDSVASKTKDLFNLFGDTTSGGGGGGGKGILEDGEEESMGAKAVEDMEAFDFGKAAYVRKIQYLEGNDARMRTGSVTLVPAQEAVVESRVVDHNYHGTQQTKTLLSYTDIANIQTKTLDEKIDWFNTSVCEELYTPWEKGHVKIIVRRHSLLMDSVDSIMALGRDDMRKRWRIEFAGEPGIEAGGLTREWFQLVTEQIFDPDFGLWLSSDNNQMSMRINGASHISCPDDHLIYFRFLGRVMGRALFDRQLIKGHMVRHLYKHLLGWPVTFEDLEAQDEEYYSSLKKFTTMEDLSVMCLDFTITEETLGVRKDIELIPGGSMKEVTSENLTQYLEANLKYRMLNRCKPQITELMLGFYDIIPEPALTVFDPNELELILCGLPTIDMDDWIDNTKYSGYYESKGRRDQVVEWFWDVVRNDFDQEMKARLLQFVTGTSGVPPRGFSVLQGNDGNIKKFCVHGVSRDQYVYPRAHTCFNRIDLPNYSTKKELREKVGQAVSMTYVGFDIE